MARRCGYCGMGGHNRRTCNAMSPELKERYQKVSSSKSITCGYCGIGGHNRTTCNKAVDDYFLKIQSTKQYRKDFIEDMNSIGLGVGSLVKSNYEALYFVQEIVWENLVKSSDGCNALRCMVIGGDTDKLYRLRTPRWMGIREQINDYYTRERLMKLDSNFEVINPITSEELKKQIPSDYLVGDNYMNVVKGRFSFIEKRIAKSGRKVE